MAKRRLQRAPHPRPAERFDTVLWFTVTLEETEPPIWRRIEIPATYDFWGPHVAIQDAMGWLDSHLHEFEVADPSTGRVVRVGIPDDEFPDERATEAFGKAEEKAVTNHGAYEERATGVEPATSSLGSCSRKGRKTMIRGDSRSPSEILGSLAVSTDFTQFH